MFRKLFKHRYPRLDWIQVEISSQCNSSCRYCPRHTYRKQWQALQLPLHAFKSMAAAFKKTSLVYLQGWGEPFMHPDFFSMLEIAKAAGAKVGTTTNGSLLSRTAVDRLVTDGIDIIAFSLAGITEKNDVIRKGTELNSILRSINDIRQAKNKYGVRFPAIHIAYLLLRSNMEEIDRMPDFFEDLGVDQVVVSTLTLVTRPDLASEAILAETPEQWEELTEKIKQIQESAAWKGVDMHFQLVSPFVDPSPCDENIKRSLVVGANGNIAPCVMTSIPVNAKTTYYFDQKPLTLPHLSFGNIFDQPLNEIWQRPDYRAFRRAFATSDLPAICRKCYKSRVVKIERKVDTPATHLVPDF